MTKTAKNPHNYLLLIWRGFWSNYKDTWGPDHPDWFRPLGRLGYNIFGSGNIQSGFISEEALKDKINGGKPVLDHYLSPQFAAGAMLEFQEKYLCQQHLDPRGEDGDRTNFENFFDASPSNLLPISLFIANSVFSGFVTACLFAG